VPANPGVNPSLTIAAIAERAMSKVPPTSSRPELPQTVAATPSPSPGSPQRH
jgi:cholesterol oxidase